VVAVIVGGGGGLYYPPTWFMKLYTIGIDKTGNFMHTRRLNLA
jgi:hypothetical protein